MVDAHVAVHNTSLLRPHAEASHNHAAKFAAGNQFLDDFKQLMKLQHTGSPGSTLESILNMEVKMNQVQATSLEHFAQIARWLKQHGSCKVWQFSKDGPEFTDPLSFR